MGDVFGLCAGQQIGVGLAKETENIASSPSLFIYADFIWQVCAESLGKTQTTENKQRGLSCPQTELAGVLSVSDVEEGIVVVNSQRKGSSIESEHKVPNLFS